MAFPARMNGRFYVDTCIWRDYLENRTNLYGSLAEHAFRFFRQCIIHQAIIVTSEIVEEELPDLSPTKFYSVTKAIGLNVQKATVTSQQIVEAEHVAYQKQLNYTDVLHAILARDNNAILITRDNDFEELGDLVTSQKPEQVDFSFL